MLPIDAVVVGASVVVTASMVMMSPLVVDGFPENRKPRFNTSPF